MSPEEQVLKTLAEAFVPLKSGEIAKAAQLEPKETAKAIKALKTAEKIISPKRCYYTVKA